MADYTVGSVYVDVLPSMRRFVEQLGAEGTAAADKIGADMGAKMADRAADKFSMRLREKLEVGVRDLPTAHVKVDADTAEATAKIDRAARDRTAKIHLLGAGLGPLGTAGLFGAPLAVPLTVAGIGLAGGLAAPFAAAAAGAVGFGAVAKSVYTDAEKYAKALAEANKQVAAAQQAINTAGTSPQARIAVEQAALRLQIAQRAEAAAKSASARASAQLRVEQARLSLQAAEARLGVSPAHQQALNAALAKRNALIAATPAPIRAASAAIAHASVDWEKFRNALAPDVLAVVPPALAAATEGLRLLEPAVRSSAGAIEGLAVDAEKALASPTWQHFSAFLGREAGPAISTFGHVVGDLGTGFANLLQDFAPVGHELEAWLVRNGSRFADWSANVGASSGFQHFMTYLQTEGPALAQTVGALGHAVVGLGIGLAPIAHIELAALEPVLKFVGDLSASHPEVITAAAIGVGAFVAASKLSNAVVGMSDAVQGLWAGLGRLIPALGGAAAGEAALGSAAAGADVALDANPIGVISLALAGLGVAAYETSQHWDASWRDMKIGLAAVDIGILDGVKGILYVIDAIPRAMSHLPFGLGKPWRDVDHQIRGVIGDIDTFEQRLRDAAAPKKPIVVAIQYHFGQAYPPGFVGPVPPGGYRSTATGGYYPPGFVGPIPRAGGGDVFAGHAYWVGERHAEMFIPKVDGRIDANPRSGPNITVNQTNYITSTDPRQVADYAVKQMRLRRLSSGT